MTMKKPLLNHSLWLGLGALLMAGSAPTFGAVSFMPDMCLPTCNTNDAKMLATAGSDLQTLAGDSLFFDLTAPPGTKSFNLAIFDGDASQQWDNYQGGTQVTEFILYADPDVDLDPGHAHTNKIEIVRWVSTGMNDNDWWKQTITTDPLFESADGNFHYRLEITNLNPSIKALNSFKVGVGEGRDATQQPVPISFSLEPQAIAFLGSYWAKGEGSISDKDRDTIYPSYPALTPTRYDGKFTMSFRVPENATSLVIHDGDLDFGDLSVDAEGQLYSANPDTDDQDTPNESPDWSPSALAEGIAKAIVDPNSSTFGTYAKVTGNPSDDASPLPLYRRSPNIRYKVCDPNNVCYYNANPSGNREWERFQLSTVGPFDRTKMDQLVTSIPAGIWTIEMEGVD